MWQEDQRRERERYWPAVERYLAGLPPRLFELGKLLEYDLAVAHSSTGRTADIFLGPECFPALSIGGWLLYDLEAERDPGASGGDRRDGGAPSPVRRAQEHLFLASFLLNARTHIVGAMVDHSSPYDGERVALAQAFTERSLIELGGVVGADSPSWRSIEVASLDELERALAVSRRPPGVTAEDPEAFLVPRWATPAMVVADAALEAAGAASIAQAVRSMLGAMAEAFEIVTTLASFHADALGGRATYPIAVVARAAGLPLRPGPDPTVALGALVATGSLEVIVASAVDRIRRAREVAARLGLPTFTAYLADAATAIEARQGSIAPGAERAAVARDALRTARPIVAISRPPRATALGMAEGYLLADPTFRESWETHREGMFGAPLVASRFPAGLVLEILSRDGLDVSAGVDAFLASTAANGFRYYDHPSSDVDTDTIGVFLRLAAASGNRAHEGALGPVLERLDREVAIMGHVPVWLPAEGRREEQVALDLGEGCGTVAAHLLLGLLAGAAVRHAETVERGSAALLGRIAEVGVAANVDYPRGFAMAVFGRLAAALEVASGSGLIGPGTRVSVERARSSLLEDLERATERSPATAQDAALLTVACLDLGRPDLVEPSWSTRVLRWQRADGGWPAEPFAAAPTRGSSVTWYSSSLLTTALCYDALVRAPE